MAMGVYHKEQLTQLLSALNGVRDMPLAEKQAIVLGAIRQYKETRRELVRRVKYASSSEIREVNKWIAKVPGHRPPKGAKFWCTECASNPVAGPFMKCQRCIEKAYTKQDHEDAMEPFNREKDKDAV